MGKIDPKLVEQAEARLSAVFLELATKYNNTFIGSGLGGDVMIFGLMYPVRHICTESISTCATNGKTFYYNPKFILKLSKIGLRLVCAHEAWHALYMHPQRRGSRNPKLWNIAVDYIVNGVVMEDLKARHKDPKKMFTEHLGRYMPLETYATLLKDPFAKIPGFEDINPSMQENSESNVKLPGIDEDRELTPEEQKELERKVKSVRFFYADPDLTKDMQRPEKIYDYLYSLLPKCPKCGSLGMYKIPKKDKKKGKEEKDKDGDKSESKDKHDHGDGKSCDCSGKEEEPGNCCDGCGGGVDIFGLGGTVDDHMDSEESEEKMAKRVADAMAMAKKTAGHVPAAMEREFGLLTAPKITWQDVIKCRLLKARAGHGRSDYTRFKNRPMFSGMLVPKRKSYTATFGCLLDTSGSMSAEDMAFGLSQLTSLDERVEGTIVPTDCEVYWNDATKIRKCSAEELSKVKATGSGGTAFAPFFSDYEKHIGKCDFLIVLTDGFLSDMDMSNMNQPKCDVFWIITSGADFVPPFGRSFSLRA
jgi:predicted metal-dependent peptidase